MGEEANAHERRMRARENVEMIQMKWSITQ
jgi:hypothetical protein